MIILHWRRQHHMPINLIKLIPPFLPFFFFSSSFPSSACPSSFCSSNVSFDNFPGHLMKTLMVAMNMKIAGKDGNGGNKDTSYITMRISDLRKTDNIATLKEYRVS